MCIGFTELQDLDLFRDKVGHDVTLHSGNFIRYAYVVSPEFRGRNIAKQLLSKALKLAQMKKLSFALATVAVDNSPSVKILLDCGFTVHYVGPVYGGRVRYVTCQSFELKHEHDSISDWIVATDIQEQREFLRRGYRGCRLRREEKMVFIGYARPRARHSGE